MLTTPRDHRVGLDVVAWPAWRGDGGNPFTGRLATALADRGVRIRDITRRELVAGHVDVVHVHWPEFALYAGRVRGPLRAASILTALAVARHRGARVVWTVHNLGGHETGGAHDWYWRSFTGLVDGWISLSDAARPAIEDRFPRLARRPSFVVPHGHFRDSYPPPVARTEARARLGLADHAKVWLWLGRIRPYKGLDSLVEAFRAVRDPDALLLVAGEVTDPAVADELVAATRHDPRIRLELGFAGPDEVPLFFGAADVVALPYRQILNSGTALLALSFDRPVLVTESPSTRELAARIPGWVHTFGGRLDGPRLERSWKERPSGRPDLTSLSWERVADLTLDAYRSTIAQG